MVTKHIENFDIKQIAASGQIFRVEEFKSPETYTHVIQTGNKFLMVQQAGKEVAFHCSENDFKNYWQQFFDLDRDYGQIIAGIDEADEYLKAAAAAGAGIRILKQDLWETIVSFMISQNNNIPRIKAIVKNLCDKLGEELQDPETGIYYMTFPGPERLANISNLHSMGLGYRDKYIVALAVNVLSGRINLLDLAEMKDYKETHNYLKSIYGIGDKVANCVQLFGLAQVDAFPIDTWIEQIVKQRYNGKFPVERYAGHAGIIQQYLFNYAMNRKEI